MKFEFKFEIHRYRPVSGQTGPVYRYRTPAVWPVIKTMHTTARASLHRAVFTDLGWSFKCSLYAWMSLLYLPPCKWQHNSNSFGHSLCRSCDLRSQAVSYLIYFIGNLAYPNSFYASSSCKNLLWYITLAFSSLMYINFKKYWHAVLVCEVVFISHLLCYTYGFSQYPWEKGNRVLRQSIIVRPLSPKAETC